jgi:hypothetical protein
LVQAAQSETDCKNYQRLATCIGNLVNDDEEVLAIAMSNGL